MPRLRICRKNRLHLRIGDKLASFDVLVNQDGAEAENRGHNQKCLVSFRRQRQNGKDRHANGNRTESSRTADGAVGIEIGKLVDHGISAKPGCKTGQQI